MSSPIIEIEGLGKKYRIGAAREPYLSLRDEFAKTGRRISSAFSRLSSSIQDPEKKRLTTETRRHGEEGKQSVVGSWQPEFRAANSQQRFSRKRNRRKTAVFGSVPAPQRVPLQQRGSAAVSSSGRAVPGIMGGQAAWNSWHTPVPFVLSVPPCLRGSTS